MRLFHQAKLSCSLDRWMINSIKFGRKENETFRSEYAFAIYVIIHLVFSDTLVCRNGIQSDWFHIYCKPWSRWYVMQPFLSIAQSLTTVVTCFWGMNEEILLSASQCTTIHTSGVGERGLISKNFLLHPWWYMTANPPSVRTRVNYFLR